MVERIRGYEVVVNEALRLLADHGFVPPAELDAPAAPTSARRRGRRPGRAGHPADGRVRRRPGEHRARETSSRSRRTCRSAGCSAGLTFARTYNSRSDRSGPFGARWASWATTRLVERTWTAEFEGPDGQRIAFPRTGSGFGRAVGVDALVERSAAGLGGWFDGRRWEFDAAGRPVRTWAGPGTAVRFVHEDDRLVELVHEHGRTMTVEWDAIRPDRVVACQRLGRAARGLPLRRRRLVRRRAGRGRGATSSTRWAGSSR